MLNFWIEQELSVQGHYVICEHGKYQSCFGPKEWLHIEAIKSKIAFEFFDPVFGTTTSTIKAPNIGDRLGKVGIICRILILLVKVFILKKFQYLFGGFWRFYIFCLTTIIRIGLFHNCPLYYSSLILMPSSSVVLTWFSAIISWIGS